MRRNLINAIPALDFLKKCRDQGVKIEQVGKPDDYGRRLKAAIPGGEDYLVVEVLNSTPEPDGSFKKYYLHVPPHMETNDIHNGANSAT